MATVSVELAWRGNIVIPFLDRPQGGRVLKMAGLQRKASLARGKLSSEPKTRGKGCPNS